MDAVEMTEKFAYSVQWSEEDGLYIATVLEFPSLSAHGGTVEGALKGLKAIVLDSVEWMIEDEESVPIPYSLRKYKGNIALRVRPEIHRQIMQNAAAEGISCNRYLSGIIENALGYSASSMQTNEYIKQIFEMINRFERLEERIDYAIDRAAKKRYPL